MSKFTGKCDFYDHIEIFGLENVLKSDIYIGNKEHPIKVESEKDLVPYYPRLISISYCNRESSGIIVLTEKSWIDYKEEDFLQWALDTIKKYRRSCVRKKIPFDQEEAYKKVVFLVDRPELRELVKRVAEQKNKATFEGIQLKTNQYYRDFLVEEMVKFGYDKNYALNWVYGKK